MKDNKRLGDIGEKAAIEYLKKQGYRIIEINFKCKQGEIDIIAADNDTIVFVEVKTRSSDVYGQPSEAVNYYKQRKIVQVALVYLAQRKLFNWMSRFDIVEVITDHTDKIININLIKNAFEYNGKYGY
ncbi:MAG TPA: YraN family protein [Clostridiales bacterium]|nr:YraN family protein [Clostridiales bacterium]